MCNKSICGLVTELGGILVPRKMKIAVAESCTGGMLASAIVGDVNASPIIDRAFVVYSIDAKCEMLGLARTRVEECGGVAEDVARAMAESALDRSHADLAVAITGFAGPRESDEEVGLIHVASAAKDGIRHRVLHLGDIGRTAACEAAVRVALEMAVDHAKKITVAPN